MKVSINTIKGFNKRYGCCEDISLIGLDKLIEKVGAQIGGIEEIVDIGAKYKGTVVARVASRVKHPNADKLSLCKIDDGRAVKDVERDDQGYVQVVCGAPNVRVGLNVAWLPPGTTVPESFDGDRFVLESREIRGQKSNGMLASPKELAFSDNHGGILEIEGEPEPGTDFAKMLGLDDTVLDIENKMFTHRPDCFGFVGIAREMAGIQNIAFRSPDWYKTDPIFPEPEAEPLGLSVKNELPELVPRFTAIVMSNVSVGPSPLWLQAFLAEMGQKSINNIVDYTNFFMLETGQPLHAYDYDKVAKLSHPENTASIVIRNPRPGEKVKLLNGKEIEPRAESIVIASDEGLIGIGGVMGGSETEVDDSTTNIILECGSFDMYSVRRTSMTHGLFTDAVTRFTKGQSPLQNLAVLAKISDEIGKYTGGKVASKLVDDNHVGSEALNRASLHPAIKISPEFINLRLGSSLGLGEMQTILENVEFSVTREDGGLNVLAPFWRTDIELREDVVEEVGRLKGYDSLPLELPKRDVSPITQDKYLQLKSVIRSLLKKAGANEVLSYSFVDKDLLTKLGQDPALAYELSNALSPELEYYRISLTPSLLTKVRPNTKSGYSKFVIYELGKTHIVDQMIDNEPAEFERLALVFSDSAKSGAQNDAYFSAKFYLETLLAQLNVAGELSYEPITEAKPGVDIASQLSLYLPGRAALVKLGDNYLGVVGEYKESVHRALKLPEKVAGFEINLSFLTGNFSLTPDYTPISSFPNVTQDITLKVPAATTYRQLSDELDASIKELKPKDCAYELEPLDIYQKDEASGAKNISFRLVISSYKRTLTDKQVNELLEAASGRVKAKLGAERV